MSNIEEKKEEEPKTENIEEINTKLITENTQLKQQLEEYNQVIQNMNNQIIEQENLIKHYRLIAELHYNNLIGVKNE